MHAIEKYLQSCPAQYKLPAIYVVDSVSRVCAASVKSNGGGDKYKEAMHQRIEQRLRGLFGMAALCTGKDRVRRIDRRVYMSMYAYSIMIAVENRSA